MKKTLIILIIVAIVVVAAKMTVPNEEKHYQVAQQKLTSLVGQKMSSLDGWKEMAEGQNLDVAALIKLAVGQMEVKDYFVCNVGRITYDGSTYPLTVGVFNHVFVLTDYMDEMEKAGKKVEEYKKKLE
ncbi:MAG: hypothetical protein J6W12_04670 [Bacteroidales bacterium]|nr:hypothetical protein [Bacteroidales bacterium]